MPPDRYRWYVLPRGDRFPAYWRHWWRLVALVVVVAGIASAVSVLPPLLSCADGFPSFALQSVGGDCVGVSDDAYDFGRPDELGAAITKIDQQNRAVRGGQAVCAQGSTVTLAVLTPFGSAGVGGRSAHELEGIAAAQGRTNTTDCVHPLLVEIANMGSREQAASTVAQRLKDDPAVVAVVGMGLSLQESAAAADLLGSAPDPVPMISDVITAQGFDALGSRGREDDFARCATTYPNGVGHGYLYRVAYGNAAQLDVLTRRLAARPDFVLTPSDSGDPYTCTSLSLIENRYDNGVPAVKFDPTDASTVPVAVQRICGTSQPVTVVYTARSRDLGRFVQAVNTSYQNGTCLPPSVSLLSLSDGNRLLAAETDPALEVIRRNALASDVVAQGKLSLVYTAFNNPIAPPGEGPSGELAERMSTSGFDPRDLADGWAVNAYDAVGVVAEASKTLSATQTVTRGQINSAVSGLTVTGAGGRISFDANGDRTGEPQLLRVCPPRAGMTVTAVAADVGTCP